MSAMKTKPDESNVAAIGQMLRNCLIWKAEQELEEQKAEGGRQKAAPQGGDKGSGDGVSLAVEVMG